MKCSKCKKEVEITAVTCSDCLKKKDTGKILITENQKQQFNLMLSTLKKIAKAYQTSEQLRRNSEKQYGLEYDEALEYAYDNLQMEAETASKGIRFIK